MGLLSKIQSEVSKSGSSRGEFFFVREGEKKRVRFLQELDDGYAFNFYKTKWGAEEFQFFVSPAEYDERDPYEEDEDLITQCQYCWSVWDYDSEEVKIFMFPVNRCSPVPPLVALNDSYGSVTDRDFVVSFTGKRTDKQYVIMPMDKAAMRNKKAKALSESALKAKIKEAYPWPSKAKPKDDDDSVPWDEEEEKAADDYDSMAVKELYKLCKERNIDAEPRKQKPYYIKKLRDADAAEDDWGDEDDDFDDDWEDED